MGWGVATLCIGESDVDGLPGIIELKQADNKPATRDVALAARQWFAMQNLAAIALNPKELPDDAVGHV
jgi:hypothetical protein